MPKRGFRRIIVPCGVFFLQQHTQQQHAIVESFSVSFGTAASPARVLLDLFKPSSTKHLADLLELYDVVQDPGFLASSEEWRSVFGSIVDGVEVTSEGVVEGRGLVAKRDFSKGEVVALYPIHAIGYSHGKSSPRTHHRSERVYCSPAVSGTTTSSSTSTTTNNNNNNNNTGEASGHAKSENGIIGDSDLVYFENESDVFGDDHDDFSFAMTDPSGRYMFDVNPGRNFSSPTLSETNDGNGSSSNTATNRTSTHQGLFVAHYVNDASFADFSPVVTAARELMIDQRHQERRRRRKKEHKTRSERPEQHGESENDDDRFVRKGKELNDAAARLAVGYLRASTGTTRPIETTRATTATVKEPPSQGFNVVMCGFGPPPLMAYVTTRNVSRGEEFLASYGLGYWLGKAFPDDSGDDALDAALDALDAHPGVWAAQGPADTKVREALREGDRALRDRYGAHTSLLKKTLRAFREDERRRRRDQRKMNRSRSLWRRCFGARKTGEGPSNGRARD